MKNTVIQMKTQFFFSNFKAFVLLIFFIGFGSASATNTKRCDSLIKSGIAKMLAKDHEASLKLLTEAKSIAEKNNWHRQEFLALNNIGGNYYLMLDYGEALNQYLESYKIAIRFLDEEHEMIVINNIGILYSKEKNYLKAEEYFTRAYLLAKKNKNALKTGFYAVNLGSVANENNKPQLARKHLLESLNYLGKQPEIKLLAEIALSQNEFLLGNVKQSRAQAEQLLQRIQSEKISDNKIVLQMIIAKAFLKENNLESALSRVNEAIKLKPDLDKKRELFSLLSKIYSKKHLYEAALQYKDSILAVNEAFTKIKNGKLFESSSLKFQMQHYQNEASEKAQKLKNERLIFFSIFIVVVLVIVLLLLIIRNKAIKNNQLKVLEKHNRQVIELKLQKEINDNLLLKEKEKTALLEQERLQKEIELRNQKISAKALTISGRNQLLSEIISDLSKLPELSQNQTLQKQVKALKQHLKTDDDWETYIKHFEEVNHSFLKNLTANHPNLSQNDIRYLSYVYMNLNTKEIAALLNITLDACKKRKERIVLRLGLNETSDLNSYLSRL